MVAAKHFRPVVQRRAALLRWLAFGCHALIAVILARHVVLLQLLQDNIFEAAEFRGPVRQTG
jgi:hypothetical protein